MVNAEQTLKELNELRRCNDTEAAHGAADSILVELVRELGYDDIADAYEAIDKWYA